MGLDMLTASGIGNNRGRPGRTKVWRQDDKRLRRRRGTGGNITKHALVGGSRRVRRDAVLELVNSQRQLRKQQDRRYPYEEPVTQYHPRHRSSSSARPRMSVK